MGAHACYVAEEVRADCVYHIAVHLDWTVGSLSMFIDGQMHVCGAAFDTSMPIRIAAIYNWRSGARTAFSELILGDTCPYSLAYSPHPWKRNNLSCHRRWRKHNLALMQGRVVHSWMCMAICVGMAAYLIQTICLP